MGLGEAGAKSLRGRCCPVHFSAIAAESFPCPQAGVHVNFCPVACALKHGVSIPALEKQTSAGRHEGAGSSPGILVCPLVIWLTQICMATGLVSHL